MNKQKNHTSVIGKNFFHELCLNDTSMVPQYQHRSTHPVMFLFLFLVAPISSFLRLMVKSSCLTIAEKSAMGGRVESKRKENSRVKRV